MKSADAGVSSISEGRLGQAAAASAAADPSRCSSSRVKHQQQRPRGITDGQTPKFFARHVAPFHQVISGIEKPPRAWTNNRCEVEKRVACRALGGPGPSHSLEAGERK